MKNTTVNISLPESMKAQIEETVAAEGYGNTSEFFRELVRNHFRERDESKLESLLLEAITNNEFAPLSSEDFDQMKSDLREHIDSRKPNREP